VVCAERFITIIYSGKENETKIYLYKKDNQFDAINSMKFFWEAAIITTNVIDLTTIKTAINAVHTLMFPNSAKNPCILRKQKIKYTVKTATDTVLTRIVLITTTMLQIGL